PGEDPRNGLGPHEPDHAANVAAVGHLLLIRSLPSSGSADHQGAAADAAHRRTSSDAPGGRVDWIAGLQSDDPGYLGRGDVRAGAQMVSWELTLTCPRPRRSGISRPSLKPVGAYLRRKHARNDARLVGDQLQVACRPRRRARGVDPGQPRDNSLELSVLRQAFSKGDTRIVAGETELDAQERNPRWRQAFRLGTSNGPAGSTR